MAEPLTPRFGEVKALGGHGFVRVAYVEWGPPDADQVVLCVHGLTRTGRDFDFLAQKLARGGRRVIAPDLPGRGGSDWVPNAADYHTPLYLASMAAVIARAGVEQVDWVGTSLGGHIGMELAALPG